MCNKSYCGGLIAYSEVADMVSVSSVDLNIKIKRAKYLYRRSVHIIFALIFEDGIFLFVYFVLRFRLSGTWKII